MGSNLTMAPFAPFALSGVVSIPLKRRDGSVRALAVIDAEDAALAARSWHLNSQGYVVCQMRKEEGRGQWTLGLHRAVMGLGRGDEGKVDHIDHDPLNNRRSNLRVGTHAQNHQNRRASGDRGSSSRYRGVSWADRVKGRPWHAYGQVNGRFTHIGYFATEEEAAEAARGWRRVHMPWAVD